MAISIEVLNLIRVILDFALCRTVADLTPFSWRWQQLEWQKVVHIYKLSLTVSTPELEASEGSAKWWYLEWCDDVRQVWMGEVKVSRMRKVGVRRDRCAWVGIMVWVKADGSGSELW